MPDQVEDGQKRTELTQRCLLNCSNFIFVFENVSLNIRTTQMYIINLSLH